QHREAPGQIEQRRLDIYSRLVYNNIETFISGGFPVLRRIMADEPWHKLVRGFIRDHHSHSPYFLEISQEFLQYLGEKRVGITDDPPFILELAHYEWVELALDVADPEPEAVQLDDKCDLLLGIPQLSAVAWSLQYTYPVHLIGPDFQPDKAPPDPTYLVVYRNRDYEVNFLESNSVTARLLELVAGNTSSTGRKILEQIAAELGREDSTEIIDFGRGLFTRLQSLDIIIGCPPGAPCTGPIE
ncbi:MAG: hypothetical protein ACI9GW_003774, partial [Halieaceae bacterium]